MTIIKDRYEALKELKKTANDHRNYDWGIHSLPTALLESIDIAIEVMEQTTWIPTSERLPEKSYCTPFWLTVKLDTGKITTLKGTWGCWSDNKDTKGNSYDAFDCWKDVMINGREVRLSQPIPKEQVLAWMPFPEPYKTESKDCQDCKEFEDCPCGKDGHESGTSQGYSIGECKDFVPQKDTGFFDEIMDDESEDGEVYEKIKEIIEKVKEQEE